MSTEIRVGPALVAGPFQAREITYPPGLRQAKHSHPAMGVTVVLSGMIREVSGGREEVGEALSVVMKPANVNHWDEVGPGGARTLQIVLATEFVNELEQSEPGFVQWRWLHGGVAAEAFFGLLWLLRNGVGCGERTADAATAAEDRVLDALGCLRQNGLTSRTPAVWLRRAQEMLENRCSVARSVREMARHLGVHEVTLSREFRRQYGCTISAYRRRVRLRRAASAIEGGTDELSRIAHAAGYSDHAHLCRDFRRATGMTPTEFRALPR